MNFFKSKILNSKISLILFSIINVVTLTLSL
jgi:hypothetical protein